MYKATDHRGLVKFVRECLPLATHLSIFPFCDALGTFFVVRNNDEINQNNGDELYRLLSFDATCQQVEALSSKRKFIRNIVSKFDVIFILTNDGLYAMGSNTDGQVGNGEKSETIVKEPCLVLEEKICQVSIGLRHCACLTDDGRVFTWGNNDQGQLGYSEESLRPVQVSILLDDDVDSRAEVKVKEIACTFDTTLALDDRGRIFCWGETYNKSIATKPSHIPKMLPTIQDVQHIYCSDDANLFAVTSDGSIYGWGTNFGERLVPGDKNWVNEPQRLAANDQIGYPVESLVVGTDFVVAKSARSLFAWGKFKIPKGDFKFLTAQNQPIEDDVKYCFYPTPAEIDVSSVAAFCIAQQGSTPGLIQIDSLVMEKRGNNFLLTYFDDSTTADLVIVVEGKKIHVHKTILTVRSVHFRTMFATKEWKESQVAELPIEHTSYEAYRAFLLYLYTDNLIPDDLTCRDAVLLIDLVKSYCEDFEADLTSLLCNYILKEFVDETSVLLTFSMAVDYEIDVIASRCMKFILKNMRQVVESEAFQNLDPRHSKAILLAHAKDLA